MDAAQMHCRTMVHKLFSRSIKWSTTECSIAPMLARAMWIHPSRGWCIGIRLRQWAFIQRRGEFNLLIQLRWTSFYACLECDDTSTICCICISGQKRNRLTLGGFCLWSSHSLMSEIWLHFKTAAAVIKWLWWTFHCHTYRCLSTDWFACACAHVSSLSGGADTSHPLP